jgi:hypothetical protein
LGKNRAKGISIRHSGNVDAKLQAVRVALRKAVKGIDDYQEQCQRMANYIPDISVSQFFENVLDKTADVSLEGKRIALTKDVINGGFDAVLAAAQLTIDNAKKAKLAKAFERAVNQRSAMKSDMLERFERSTNGLGNMRDTLWGFTNAATEHFQHSTIGRRVREQDNAAYVTSHYYLDNLVGTRDDNKQVVWQEATKLMTA